MSSSAWPGLWALIESVPHWVFFPSLLVAFVLTVLVYLAYSGLFSAIAVAAKEPPIGDLVVAYKTARGPYSGAAALFTETYSLLPERRCLGIYYDDPESVSPAELRFAVGCVLSDGEDDSPDHQEMDLMVDSGFKIAHLPRPNYAVLADFPFRTTASIYLAIWRVYPRLKRYITAGGLCAYPAVEIYRDSSILFMMPLSRQEEWFVPEFSEEAVSVATSAAGSRVASPETTTTDQTSQEGQTDADADATGDECG